MEQYINKVRERPPYRFRDDAQKLHGQLTIIDLHADSLLWNRNLLRRNNIGQVDIPRLQDGNVTLQVFGVVTHFPLAAQFPKAHVNIDLVRLLSIIDRWPRETWNDPFQRAIFQARKLARLVEEANGKVKLVKSAGDLNRLLALRRAEPQTIGALLSLEGVHALNGELQNLKTLYDMSFRMIGITHFIDNAAGGSAHGSKKGGLTDFGTRLIEMAQGLHMLIDLSHASARVFDDVVDIARAPVIVSHTGVCGVQPGPRNLTDAQIKKIADLGGVVGIAMFRGAVGGDRVDDVARSIRYVADLVGVDHAGLGSDFDGGITAPIDVTGLALITEKLLEGGFTDEDVSKIMGGNALRVFRETLPA